MTAAASSTRSGSILAATSAEPYPRARVSKMAESWRRTPSSLTRATRSRTASSLSPSRSPSTANGRGSSGKSHCTALRSSRSSASSWSSLAVVVMPSWSRGTRAGGQLGPPVPVSPSPPTATSPAAAGRRRRASMVSVWVRPPRTYWRSSGSWGRRVRTAATSSGRPLTALPAARTTTSPATRPAFAAGLPGNTQSICAPPPARSASSFEASTPSQPWITLPDEPLESSWSSTSRTLATGMARPPAPGARRVGQDADDAAVAVDQRAARHVRG